MWLFLTLLIAAADEKVAPFVIAKKDTPPELTAAVREATWRAATTALKDAVIPELVLAQKIGSPGPDKAIEKCGSNLGCIAKLARKVGAAKVLFARVVKGKKHIEVQLLVIGASSKRIEQRNLVVFENVAEVRAKLVDQIYALLAINGPGHLEIAGATGDVSIDGKVVGTGAGTYTVTPGRHDVQVGGVSVSVLVLPGGFERLNIAPAPQVITVSSGPVAASQPSVELPPQGAPAEVVFRTEPTKRGTTLLLPIGAVLAGVGLAAIGGGVYFGVTSQTTRGGIVDGMTQLDAERLNRDANTQAIVANALFGGGGLVAALGVTLVIVDLVLAKKDVTPIAVISKDGVMWGIHAAW